MIYILISSLAHISFLFIILHKKIQISSTNYKKFHAVWNTINKCSNTQNVIFPSTDASTF